MANLHAFRRAIRETATSRSFVLVPSRAAGRQLERSAASSSPLVCVNREELYEELHARLPGAPRSLTAIERDVFAQASARAVADAGAPLAFQLRPSLVAEMLRFYDQLRRQSQTVDRFEELISDAIGDGESDAGVLRMRHQTGFLADTFREYERRVRASNACDEHILRERLTEEPASDPIRHVIVTVADWIADEGGLYVADFDLLSRMPGVESIDIVATEGVLRSGFRERLDRWLPGLEEAEFSGSAPQLTGPVLLTPATDDLWFTYRDREEELVAVCRALGPVPTAVVYKQPLPYLYVAADVFGDGSIAYHGDDALPLAIEPTAAAFDVILEAATTEFTRDSLVALLRCPHLDFGVDREAVSAFDRRLSDARFLGGLDPLERLEWPDAAYRAAVTMARELAPLRSGRPASEQLRQLLGFWASHARPLPDEDPFGSRERRSRAAIVDALESLAQVNAQQDDPAWTIDDLATAVRRAIEGQTFVPESAADGVHLLDDHAAPYGDFDDVFIVGLVENEWPVKPRRNIFYPPGLLNALGWPTEKDRRAAADARFVDLIASASRRTCISTFTLDDDSLVSPSMELDEIPRARLRSTRLELAEPEAPSDRRAPDTVPGDLAADMSLARRRQWAALRASRSGFDRPAFHGGIGPQPARAWSVSALETYLGCPFRFFAQHVLRLTEDPDDEETIDPRRQGQLVHEVFERFFREWQSRGRGTITASNLDAARALFEQIVDGAIGDLPPAEGGLERTRLLGSPAAAGLGEAVFRMEAERPIRVVERLIEHRLEGVFTIATDAAARAIPLTGKADRIDLLEDGTFRLIDYKLGWPPDRSRALQLPIYSVCAEQRLASYRGRRWTMGEAAYLAFKGPRRVVPLCAPGARDAALTDAQQRLADTVAAIERGEFPPTPDDTYRCETCSFAGVCRKDYVGDV